METRDTRKERDKKKNVVGPEYPGEGAINNSMIAGSTAVQDLL